MTGHRSGSGAGAATAEWVRLELDVEAFDPNDFGAELIAVEQAGIRLSNLAEQGDTPVNRRRLYELNAECSVDIPGRGPFHSWTEYQARRLDVPSFDPGGVVLALDGHRWIAMAACSDHRHEGFVFAEMTGVVRTHRRRGIALAAKVRSVEHARSLRVRHVRCAVDSRNEPMLALNRRLGFVAAAAAW